MEEWDRVAWLCYWMPRFGGRKKKPKDFQPFRMEDTEANLRRLDEIVRSKILPDSLTNEEIDKVLEKYARKEDDARG